MDKRMQVIGLLGGMSWESTASYYRIINEEVKNRLGKLHSANVLLYSLDFEEIEILQHQGLWAEATEILIKGARRVQNGGADFLMICTNTMHIVAEDIQAAIDIPIVHIADATADCISKMGLKRIGLLGTRFTMEKDFYRGRLSCMHDLDVITPDEEDREYIHSVIYNELCLGKLEDSSRKEYGKIVGKLISQGAEGVILGCTEIGLLIGGQNYGVPLFDTAEIHAKSAVKRALVPLTQPNNSFLHSADAHAKL